MTRSVITVRPNTSLKEVARLLDDNRISGVPVVDRDGALVGVVSEADFLTKASGSTAARHRTLARIFARCRATPGQLDERATSTAGDAMTTPATTIGSDRSIAHAAAEMTARRVNRLPVVDDGRLVGIVTRADLVRAYARSDEQLTETVREDVLRRTLWLDPKRFEVAVTDGQARIRGRVDRRSTAEMIGRAVAMVPGIVNVVVDVTWEIDDDDIRPPTTDPVFPFGPR
ncbi:MAG: CBS domain-containing protein [Chloroflexota bacterium]